MENRRSFIKKAALGSGLLLAGHFPFKSFAAENKTKLTILHTNDVHSRLIPFPYDGGLYEGQGGVAARAALINEIRAKEAHILLLDAGDMFQGSEHFNLHKGAPEIKAMNMLGYDAATIGNHDFDAGIDALSAQVAAARFPFVIANYDVAGTPLEGKTKSYTIIQKGDIKIGVFGVGLRLDDLIPASRYSNIKYLDPVQAARITSDKLKNIEKCNMVICLSHLGYEYNYGKISDKILAAETEHIDLIVGGHTHTFLTEPTQVRNKKGVKVAVNHAGWGGVRLGRLDYEFCSKKSSKLCNAQSVIVTKQTIGK